MSSEQPHSPAIPVVAAGSGSPVAEIVREVFRNRGFLVCLLLLIALLVSFQLMAKATGMKQVKKAVWPKAQLNLLDRSKLAPYALIPGGAREIGSEMLDALGTREYVQWTMEDTSADRASPTRYVHLFVTYYTDDPGQVPHVPEECYLGGGYNRSSEEIVEVPIPELQQTVAFKLLTFERSAFLGRESQVVMYTFHTNGRFAPDRHVVRTVLNNPRDEYAYFSKLEISFGTGEASPTREQAIEAGTRFLRKVVPVLIKDHWPDWEQVLKQQSSEPAQGG